MTKIMGGRGREQACAAGGRRHKYMKGGWVKGEPEEEEFCGHGVKGGGKGLNR